MFIFSKINTFLIIFYVQISMRDYHLEFHGIYDCLFKTLKSPVLLIYATPPPYGAELYEQIMRIMGEISQSNKSTVDLVPFEGTHHFHMVCFDTIFYAF